MHDHESQSCVENFSQSPNTGTTHDGSRVDHAALLPDDGEFESVAGEKVTVSRRPVPDSRLGSVEIAVQYGQGGAGKEFYCLAHHPDTSARLMKVFNQFINDVGPHGTPYSVRSQDQKLALDKARSAKKARSRPCPTPDTSRAEGRQNVEARGPQLEPRQRQTRQRRNGKQEDGISIGPNDGRNQQMYLCGITSDPIREERVVWQSNES